MEMSNVKLDNPTLILGTGICASGKTTVLREVNKRVYDTFLIDKDIINDTFLSTVGTENTLLGRYKIKGPKIQRKDDYYHRNVKFQSYQYMLEIARQNIEMGKNPIIDGNYTNEIQSGYFDELLFPFFEPIEHVTKIVHFYADENTIRKRIEEKRLERDLDKIESDKSWQCFLKSQPIIPKQIENYSHLKVNTDEPLENCVSKVLNYLKKKENQNG
jgi:adenylate kinase